jgi:hypothetical protein
MSAVVAIIILATCLASAVLVIAEFQSATHTIHDDGHIDLCLLVTANLIMCATILLQIGLSKKVKDKPTTVFQRDSYEAWLVEK